MFTNEDDRTGGEGGAKAGAGTHVGTVGLVVRDLSRMTDFYRERIGLEPVDTGAGEATLGAGGQALLHLREDPAARPDDPRGAGLFHTAFLLPARADLGRWLTHAIEGRLGLDGAADHLVSEALYLTDPEGNGIEIYSDRPAGDWSWVDGQVAMDSLALDLEALVGAADGAWSSVPAGTTVGHIHLRVGALDAAEEFYGGLLGLDLVNGSFPGARFFSRAGYHHHVGTNAWRSRGAGRREAGRTGLDWFELVLDGPGFDAAVARLGGHETVEDSWGTRIALRRTG